MRIHSKNLLARIWLLWIACAPTAWANGAFPNSMQIFTPADAPNRVIVTATFGIVLSEDNGGTWHLICEEAVALFVSMYQLSLPPTPTLMAATPDGLQYSRDVGCSWESSAGALTGLPVVDVYADPSNGNRAFVLATSVTDAGDGIISAYESTNGGETFSHLRTADMGSLFSGVEVAKSDPTRIYLTVTRFSPLRPSVLRSDNSGSTWTEYDLSAFLGQRPVRLAAVDSADPQKLFFRVLDGTGDALGISENGGQTAREALKLGTSMTGFLRRANGEIWVATGAVSGNCEVDPGGAKDGCRLFVSKDGGQTFVPVLNAPRIRAFSERGGWIYVSADDVQDGFAAAVSRDDGQTWEPILRFVDIKGTKACGTIPTTCAEPWRRLQPFFKPAPGPDAGTQNPNMPVDPPPTRKGCGCNVAAGPFSLFALLLALGRHTRRRR